MFLAGLGLHCREGFSLAAANGGYSLINHSRASHCPGFSCCRARALGHTGFSSCAMGTRQLWLLGFRAQDHQLQCTGLVAPGRVGSSQIRDGSLVSCVGRQFFTAEPLGKPAMFVCLFVLNNSFIELQFTCHKIQPFKGLLNSSFVCHQGFSDGSADKESACNEGDLGLSPGLGRSPGEGNSLPTPVFWPGEFSPWGHRVRHD